MATPSDQQQERAFSLRRFRKSLSYALRGVGRLFSSGANFRIHTTCAVVVIIVGLFLHITAGEWLAIFLCIGLVMALEGVNSAIETLCDRISTDYHPLIRDAKDMAAGAVLIAAFAALICALIIFIPKIATLFQA